jgi:hypothetical protein
MKPAPAVLVLAATLVPAASGAAVARSDTFRHLPLERR